MNKIFTVTKQGLNAIKENLPTRKMTTIFLLLAVLMPIAAPLPSWAYSLKIQPLVDNDLRLTAEKPSLATSSVNFLDSLMGKFGAFISPSLNSDKKGEPETAFNKEELEKKITSIETQIDDKSKINVGEILSLAAIPLDNKGNVINGLGLSWKSSNPNIIKIISDTQAVAVREGEVKLTVSSDKTKKEIFIRVLKNLALNKSSANRPKPLKSNLFDDPPIQPVISEQQAESMVSPENNLGTPIGQIEAGSPTLASATRTRERAGSANYSFDIPVASLPGRGINASVGIVYNSRVWNKSNFGSTLIFDFDIDKNWLAPGFELGFGHLEAYYTAYGNGVGYLLTGPNGTRHQLIYKQVSGNCVTYESTDGTFVQTTVCGIYAAPTMLVLYPDGSRVTYGAITASGKRFPTTITDRNGNMISIAYLQSDSVGKISYIRDTLNRYINFHYDNTPDKKLVAVTVPGYNNSQAPRQTIRFYYHEMPLNWQGRFSQDAQVNAPATVKVLKYVYFPGTQSGFKYDYSPYFGMIYKIWQLRGMQVSTMSLTETGTVDQISDNNWAAWTHYNYPSTTLELPAQPLSDVPKYSWRKDDWQGRTTETASQIFYNIQEVTQPNQQGTLVGERITKVTAPDGTTSVSISNIKPGEWDNGLLRETKLITVENGQERIWSKTKMYWAQGNNQPQGRDNPRVDKIEITNDAQQIRAISFGYDSYNNQILAIERDFAAENELGAELRRTETSYETGIGWINNRLIRLPKTIKTIVNNTVVSKIEYEYDGNPLKTYGTSPITQHDVRYNAGIPDEVYCYQVCPQNCNNSGNNFSPCSCPLEEVCETIPVFNPNTNYRGNVTKITSYSNATLQSDPNALIKSMKYDVVGNETETIADCCEIKKTNYSSINQYAYPTSEIRGANQEFTSSATYDYNTGLIKSAVDENGQTLELTYNADNLRITRKDRPDGGFTSFEYHDEFVSGPNGRQWSYKKTTVRIDNNKDVSGWEYFDGRGSIVRRMGAIYNSEHQSVSDVEYDNMNRVVRSSNPYSAQNAASSINPTNLWTTRSYDPLGRVVSVTLPDNTIVQSQYNGTITTVTDQAGKRRRQITDALGRVIRLDEPDSNGNLGDLDSPFQPTFYEYDGNSNLAKIIQSLNGVTQQRIFKYDSLSRITHENQPEMNATLNDNGERIQIGGLWTSVFKYNSHGLLEEGIDARGVKSKFIYDIFNRIKKIEYFGEIGYETPTVNYFYDEVRQGYFNHGRLTKVETAAIGDTPMTSQIYDYDRFGRTVKQVQQFGDKSYTLKYTYNMIGDLIKQEYPSGRTVEYELDGAGRLSKVNDVQNIYASNFIYSQTGALSSFQLGNGTTQNFTFNTRSQLTSQSLIKGNEVLQKYEYSYGQIDMATGQIDPTKNSGELAKIDAFIGGTTTNPIKQWQQRFDYDSLGRLSEVREINGETNALTYKYQFDFDRFGNMYRKAANNPTTGQENPLSFIPIEESDVDKASNRFVSKPNAEVTYDDNGNLILDKKFRGRQYKYDANGRMVWTKLADNTGLDSTSVYDALGNRVGTKVNGVWQIMVYDVSGTLVAEYGGAPSDNTGGLKYVFSDWQGSIRAQMNQNGFVTGRFDYQAFGGEIYHGVGKRRIEQGFSVDSTLRNRYALTERDEATGLEHTTWRKHDTNAGRWTTPDPYKGSISITNPQSFNRYSYVGNDPINFVDPSGLFWMINYASCQYVGWIAVGNGETLEFYDVYVCGMTWVGPTGPFDTGGGPGIGGGSPPPPPPSNNCDARETGNSQIDETARILFAEASDGNRNELRAIGQVFLNRLALNTTRFGCQDWGQIMSRASIADDGRGSSQYQSVRNNQSLSQLAPGDCEGFKIAQEIAKEVVGKIDETKKRGRAEFSGSENYENGHLLWFLGSAGRTTPTLQIGKSKFYDFNPANPKPTKNDPISTLHDFFLKDGGFYADCNK